MQNKYAVTRRVESIRRKNFWHGTNPFLINLESNLLADYYRIIHKVQKSRAQWMKLGDWKTKLFHITTLTKRRRNKINALKLPSG